MPKESPLETVKRLYGDRDKLIDDVVAAAKSAGEDASELKDRLVAVSNKKLIRLAAVSKEIKDRYGGREKLVGALGQALGKAKDNDYVEKLRTFSSARLLDMMRTAEKRAKNAK